MVTHDGPSARCHLLGARCDRGEVVVVVDIYDGCAQGRVPIVLACDPYLKDGMRAHAHHEVVDALTTAGGLARARLGVWGAELYGGTRLDRECSDQELDDCLAIVAGRVKMTVASPGGEPFSFSFGVSYVPRNSRLAVHSLREVHRGKELVRSCIPEWEYWGNGV